MDTEVQLEKPATYEVIDARAIDVIVRRVVGLLEYRLEDRRKRRMKEFGDKLYLAFVSLSSGVGIGWVLHRVF